MKRISKWVGYFFNGIKVIANNKIAVIIIFSFGIFLLNKTLCYKEKLMYYEKDDIREKIYLKEDQNINYYYDDNKEINISKDIAASELVSCINNKVELNNINDDIKTIINKINDLFNSSGEYFSFLYKDIYTGFTVSYNADSPIFTASTIKAPAMIYLYELASKEEIDLNEELTYTRGYYSDGSGVLKNKNFDTKYSIDTLIEYSIHDSDNAAYAMLMNRFKRENIANFWKEKGTKNIYTYNSIWGTTSATDASIYMQELYNFCLNDEEYGNRLINYFKNAEWKMITDKNGTYNTANKGGWSGKTFHDVAIVFDKNPYILVIMSNTGESDFNYLFTNASELAGNLHSKYWEYKINKCNEIKQY